MAVQNHVIRIKDHLSVQKEHELQTAWNILKSSGLLVKATPSKPEGQGNPHWNRVHDGCKKDPY